MVRLSGHLASGNAHIPQGSSFAHVTMSGWTSLTDQDGRRVDGSIHFSETGMYHASGSHVSGWGPRPTSPCTKTGNCSAPGEWTAHLRAPVELQRLGESFRLGHRLGYYLRSGIGGRMAKAKEMMVIASKAEGDSQKSGCNTAGDGLESITAV